MSATPATKGRTESSRSAISDSPVTEDVAHARSAMSWWFSADPVKITSRTAADVAPHHDDLVGPEAVSELGEP